MKKKGEILYKGLNTDSKPSLQDKASWRYAYNAQIHKSNGLVRENSNSSCGNIPDGYIVIGNLYVDDNETVLFLVNKEETNSIIAVIDVNCNYREVVNSNCLGFKIQNQIDATYKLRNGCEKIVYFTGLDYKPKFLDISNPKQYEKEDSDSLPVGEKFDCDRFNLIKNWDKAPLVNISENVGGDLPNGSYNVSIIYGDDDYNETNVATTTDTLNLYRDSKDDNYQSIAGSLNKSYSDFFEITDSNKSIKVEVSNLDTTFPYYKIIVFEASSGNGSVTRTYETDFIDSSQTEYIISSFKDMTVIPKEKISFDNLIINSAEHIEQLDNRLLLSNTKGVDYPICENQVFASRIKSSFITRDINAYNVEYGNDKHPSTPNTIMGFQSNEVIPFGIVYVYKDGYESPVFHIPGIASNQAEKEKLIDWNESISYLYPDEAAYNALPTTDKLETWQIKDTSIDAQNSKYEGAMQYWESKNGLYETRNDCSSSDYWGKDYYGNDLSETKIRHHRFPSREHINLMSSTSTSTDTYGFYFKICLTEDNYTDDDGNVSTEFPFNEVVGDIQYVVLNIDYTIDGINYNEDYKIYKQDDCKYLFVKTIDGAFNEDDVVFTWKDTNYDDWFEDAETEVKLIDVEVNTQGTFKVLGIKFDNIEYPPNVVGHYFVTGIRDSNNRLVQDSGIFSTTTEDDKFICSARFNNNPDGLYSVNKRKDVIYFINPKDRMIKRPVNGDYISLQGHYEPDTTRYSHAGVIQDVVDGSSEKKFLGVKFDKDGWSWSLGFRWIDYKYATKNEIRYKIEDKTSLPPQGIRENYDGNKSLVNAAYDDKQVFYGLHKNTDLPNNTLGYGYIMKDVDVHPNLNTIKYRRLGSKILSLTSSNEHYNGDVYIGNINMVRSQYYQDTAKSRWLKLVLTIVVITIATIATAGAALGGLAALSATALVTSATAALVIATGLIGITSEIMFAFAKALNRDLNHVFQDPDLWAATPDDSRDDTQRYYGEVISNIFIESEVPIGLRTDDLKICTSYLKTPSIENIITYFEDKYLFYDTERELKRSLKPHPCPETYFVNKDYMRQNEVKIYHSLPNTYNCCSECVEEFPNRVYWSLQAFQEEKSDNYTKMLPNNYVDIPSEFGVITDLWVFNNQLFIHTTRALYKMPRNLQERVTDELVTYIGTGEFLSIPPMRILDDDGASVGCSHKWATTKNEGGVFFVSELNQKIYRFTGKLTSISSIGEKFWSDENVSLKSNTLYEKSTGFTLPMYNNPYSPAGVGFTSIYDKLNNRVIFSKKDFDLRSLYLYNDYYLVQKMGKLYVFNEKTTIISSNEADGYKYHGIKDNKMVFSISNTSESKTYTDILKDGTEVIRTVDYPITTYKYVEPELVTQLVCNDVWTKSFDLKRNFWISYHYYNGMYFRNNNTFFHIDTKTNDIWRHNIKNKFGHINNYPVPFIVEYISTGEGNSVNTFESLEVKSKAERFYTNGDKSYEPLEFFNKIWVYNETQMSGEKFIRVKDTLVIDDTQYLPNQILDLDYLIADNNEERWFLNDFRNSMEFPYSKMFDNSCESRRDRFNIDKVIREDSIIEKDWFETEVFRGDYIIIRLFYHKMNDDIRIGIDSTIELTNKSIR